MRSPIARCAMPRRRTGTALDPAARARLGEAWRHVAPHPDAAPALRALGERGVPRVVLTNGTPATAAAALANAGLAGLIDRTFSVESAGVFKPDRRVYSLVTEHYRVAPERLVFVTSNGWDATGAATFGMRVAWCNRSGAPAETFGPPPAWTIGTLDEVVGLATAESPS